MRVLLFTCIALLLVALCIATNGVEQSDVLLDSFNVGEDRELAGSTKSLRRRVWRDFCRMGRRKKQVKRFSKIARRSGLVKAISLENPVTVFAPNDDAFAKVDLRPFQQSYNEDIFRDLLKLHVLKQRFTAEKFVAAGTAAYETLTGAEVTLRPEEGGVFVDSSSAEAAQVVKANYFFRDGTVVHFINNILLPPDLPKANFVVIAQENGLTELINALTIADLVSVAVELPESGLTLFAPTNAAFEDAAEANGITKENGEEFFTDAIQRVLGKEAFATVLKNHVAAPLLSAAQLTKKAEYTCDDGTWGDWVVVCEHFATVKAVGGADLRFRLQDEALLVTFGEDFDKTSEVVAADARSFLGFAHVIDAVILP